MWEMEREILKDKINGLKKPCIVAIDGRCGSGKITLGTLLASDLDADLLHMDDFYLQTFQRTPSRYAMPGENVDHERVEEVLKAWRIHQPFTYQKFNCAKMALDETVSVHPKDILVVEGSYSFHPSLQPYYDLCVFVTIDSALQQTRLLAREGQEKLAVFNARWIPLEEAYFSAFEVEKQADVVLHSHE
jgi:uridine kinase